MLKKLLQTIPYLLLALGVSVLYIILDGFTAVHMLKLIDYALEQSLDLLYKNIPQLMIFVALLVPVGILSPITMGFYKKKANLLLKQYYIKGVFRKNIAEFQKENTAKYLSCLSNDFQTLETNLIDGIYTVGSGIASFFVGIWILSTVNPFMIVFSFVIIVINIIISILFGKPLQKKYKERSDLFDGYTSYIKEVLSAFHIVKNHGLQDKITQDYNEKSEMIQQKGYVIEKLFSYINGLQNFLMNGSLYLIVGVVGYMAVSGKISVAGILIVTEGMQRMANPLFQISESLPKLFTSKALIQKIETSLKNADDHRETLELKEFEDSIVLKDVDFQYEEEQKILQDVNLTLRKNGKYLIVGPSGGGKSTLLKLLRKYYKPSEGNIIVDGKNLYDVKKEDFFKLIANVEQQIFIFEDTLRNNITLYKEYQEKEIEAAIKDAGLEDFVKGLPEGLDTVIYDNGKNISGGERSRVVIARALLAKSSILFMDEAFASLDMEKAREIEKTILGLNNITVINVSHVIFKDTKHLYDKVITVKHGVYELEA